MPHQSKENLPCQNPSHQHCMGMSFESSNLGTQPSGNRGAFVTCTDLTYKVRVRGRRGGWKTIVQGLDMYLVPGEMAVVMGPSGSGE